MIKTVYVRFDKFRNKEQIGNKKDDVVDKDFGYTLMDFISTDVKQRYYDIIQGANKENHKEIYQQVKDLFNQDDTLLCKLFDNDYERFIKKFNLADYSAPYIKHNYKTKTDEYIKNIPPFNSLRDEWVRKVLDTLETTRQRYITILDFCSIDKPVDNANIYNRYINKFIYACKTILPQFNQPMISYDKDNYKKITDITLDDLEKGYIDSKPLPYADTNPQDDCYYVCTNIDEYFVTVMFRLFERQYIISKCKNCGKLFVPFRNNTAIYCDRPSPQNSKLTCKKFQGSKPKGLNTLYRKIYQKKFARVSRNSALQEDFDKWKLKAKEIKAKYNKDLITDDEYKKWLIENDK